MLALLGVMGSAASLSGQSSAAVTVSARLVIPPLFQLTTESSTVTDSGDGQLARVRLRVSANRGWTLVVACGEAPAEGTSEADVDGDGAGSTDPAFWRRAGEAAYRPCAPGEMASVAEGSRVSDQVVLLEYLLPEGGAAPLDYSVVPR